ncbi:hypothetical protein LCGC14_2393550 [marine sediment metagenome]|uniref:Uncharacterized protein n=1 Tax=marine sediment metagenome TaxID=412755 RepID=A0A0F9CJI7_9ZZZZ
MKPPTHTRTAEATFGWGSSWVKAIVRYNEATPNCPTTEILLPNHSATLSMNAEQAQHIINGLSDAIIWAEEEVKNLKF